MYSEEEENTFVVTVTDYDDSILEYMEMFQFIGLVKAHIHSLLNFDNGVALFPSLNFREYRKW